MYARTLAKLGLTLGVVGLLAAWTPGDLAVGTALEARSKANKKRFVAHMHGGQEVPSIFTTGRGTLVLRIDDRAETIRFALDYADLEGETTTAAHVHFGQPGVNGGVMFWLCGPQAPELCTPGSGSFSGTITPAEIVGPASQGIGAGEFHKAVAAIRSGLTYGNVHSDMHPGGEIRGQLR